MGADIGFIGLAVMGENLVLNIERNGFSVAVFNRTTTVVDRFLAGRAHGKRITGAHSIAELVSLLARPRKIMLMVKAGSAVDAVIDQILPLLEKGDLVIDGGNSHYQDTIRRMHALEAAGIHFIGTG
ncbi:NAD(P)-binding domain-containing protein, partial [Treponema pallidum]